jgi:hypothetical protein
MKKIIIAVTVILAIGVMIFLQYNKTDTTTEQDQQTLQLVLKLSREYTALRYDTDNILLNASQYQTYETWNSDLEKIISRWQTLEIESRKLQALAEAMPDSAVSFSLTATAFAYDKQEISDIFDRAPAGKKIATLAKHLGVDAKTAYTILRQDQTEAAEAWNKAGNALKTLETSAVLIKDGCKIATFVGAIALTGGTAALAGESLLAQAAVVVAGADLTLEVTDDAAKIALGDKNKLSSIINCLAR